MGDVISNMATSMSIKIQVGEVVRRCSGQVANLGLCFMLSIVLVISFQGAVTAEGFLQSTLR